VRGRGSAVRDPGADRHLPRAARRQRALRRYGKPYRHRPVPPGHRRPASRNGRRRLTPESPPMKFIDRHSDAWLLLPDSEIAGPAPHRLLTLAQWEAVRDAWNVDVP